MVRVNDAVADVEIDRINLVRLLKNLDAAEDRV